MVTNDHEDWLPEWFWDEPPPRPPTSSLSEWVKEWVKLRTQPTDPDLRAKAKSMAFSMAYGGPVQGQATPVTSPWGSKLDPSYQLPTYAPGGRPMTPTEVADYFNDLAAKARPNKNNDCFPAMFSDLMEPSYVTTPAYNPSAPIHDEVTQGPLSPELKALLAAPPTPFSLPPKDKFLDLDKPQPLRFTAIKKRDPSTRPNAPLLHIDYSSLETLLFLEAQHTTPEGKKEHDDTP